MMKRKRQDGCDHSRHAAERAPKAAKRKRRKFESNVDAPQLTIRRRPSADAAAPSLDAGPGPSQSAVVDVRVALDPPPGLSGSQRRRWLKRHKRAIATATQRKGSIAGLLSQHPTQPGDAVVQKVVSMTSRSTQTSETSFLKRLAVTKLVPRPEKVWIDETAPDTDPDRYEETAASDQLQDADLLSVVDEDQHEATSTEGSTQQQPANTSSPPPAPFAPLPKNKDRLRLPQPCEKPNLFALKRPSFSRATSVPSHSGIHDVRAAFGRFDDFIRETVVDSSDEDSDTDGEGAIEGRKLAMTRSGGKGNATVQLPIQEGSSAQELRNRGRAVGKIRETNAANLDSPALPIAKEMANGSSQDPNPSAVFSSAWPANVGIKRQLPSRRQVEEAQSSHVGSSGESNAPPTSSALDNADMQSDSGLMDAIDDITKHVFESTRPLPVGKRSVSPDDDGVRREPGLTNLPSRDVLVTNSTSTPTSNRSRVCDRVEIVTPGPAAAAFVCYNVQTPDERRDEESVGSIEEAPEGISENIDVAIRTPVSLRTSERATSSPLSELSESPSVPADQDGLFQIDASDESEDESTVQSGRKEHTVAQSEPSKARKRKMTGRTSKHFTPEKPKKRTQASIKDPTVLQREGDHQQQDTSSYTPTSPAQAEDDESYIAIEEKPAKSKRKRKGTGKKSEYFTPPRPVLDLNLLDRVDLYNSTGKKKHVPAGTSTAPVPPITSTIFGIIQEKLWQEPFWLLIAVTFLNKTAGRAAAPIFWQLKARWPSPEALANADQTELHDLIYHLGLQTQRSKRVIKIAQAWIDRAPTKGMRFRTLHYPVRDDGKIFRKDQVVEEDADACQGALEIGHIPGLGPYAWDSWRIFCRDTLRGVADDYNGKGAGDADFVPEWQKVLPGDKELRACLRWMWLRDGFIWNHETGEKRAATAEEMVKAALGEMEVPDADERKFAAQAAEKEAGKHEEKVLAEGEAAGGVDVSQLHTTKGKGKKAHAQTESAAGKRTHAQHEPENSDDNVVLDAGRKRLRRSARLSGNEFA